MRRFRELIEGRGGMLLPLALIFLVVISALAVVRTKHENRVLVNQLNGMRSEKERLNMEWAQLQLEEATLSHHARVEKNAREQLGMTEPHDYVVVSSKP
ncbi:cell division protein FtsL [Stenotrophobium rhamnosiphilum]|uniref:Cell division protein FtsL n=1 Tax=Stenotrophobium rhamnosiphilum TaxID=2029166 RepID=A0A2T5MDR7_9GAMM|nr:cell division protein FtsL [Stenotrophobium rhamnosiphilum]PTU30699.1 cell division protein FtsL [Stenotrophobium rhamnosiphilum]